MQDAFSPRSIVVTGGCDFIGLLLKPVSCLFSLTETGLSLTIVTNRDMRL